MYAAVASAGHHWFCARCMHMQPGRPQGHRYPSISKAKQSKAASCTLYQQPCASSIHHASSPLFPDHPSRPPVRQSYNFSDANLYPCNWKERETKKDLAATRPCRAKATQALQRHIITEAHTRFRVESTDHGAGGPTNHLVKTKDGGGGRSMEKYQGEASMHPCTCKARKLKADPEADDETS